MLIIFLVAFIVLPWIYAKYRASQRFTHEQLKGKSILITGCDTGFGHLTALRLSAKKDIKVFAGCLTQKGVDDLKAKGNEHLVPFLLDVTKQESIDEAFETVKRGLDNPNGLWAIINNAGLLRGSLLELTPIEDWQLMFNVNVFGMAMVCRKFIPLLRKNKGSRIINIASVAGRTSLAGISAYGASKHAVEALSDSLRREMLIWGVKVVIIEPGVMKTPLYDVPLKTTVDSVFNKLSEDAKQTYGREYFEKSHESSKRIIDTLGSDPQYVVDALELAVTSQHPLHRQSVGKDTPVWLLLSYLPSYISDFLTTKMDRNPPIPQALKK